MASVQFKKGQNGKKTFYVVFSHRGRHRWIKAGSQADAKRLKKEIESMAENQRLEKLGITTRNKRIDDFFREYLEYIGLRTAPNTVKRYRAAINAFVAFLSMFHSSIRHLSQLKQEHVESYQRERLKSVELKTTADGDKNGNHKNKRLPLPQTVNFEVGVLRSAFIWAQDHNWIAVVPTRKVKRLKPVAKRIIKVLSEEECSLLLKTGRELGRKEKQFQVCTLMFQFILNTGLRSGEICNLMWRDIDLGKGQIHIQEKPGWTPKTNERSFYLNDTCIEILASLDESDDYVFSYPAGKRFQSDDLRRILIKIAKEAGLQELTRVHDLRHTFSALWQMRGVDRGTMATILGHENEATTKIYTHQTAEHLKESINRVRVG